jgi:glycosyltransferase involved in cell wall biosynthesis
MRVLMLNYEYPPIGGGAANATACMLPHLAAFGVQVDLLTTAPACSFELLTPCPGVRVIRLPVPGVGRNYQGNQALLGYTLAAALRLPTLLSATRYDLAHAFFALPSGLLGYLARGRMPYLISLRGSDVPGFSARFAGLHRALHPLSRAIWHGAAGVVANSAGLRNLAHASFPDLPIEVIPNGVDTDEFAPPPSRRRDGAVRVICVARLIPRKGIADLLQAIADLRGSNRDVELDVVGDGPLLAELRVRAQALGIASAVRWHGHVEHHLLPPLYTAADIFAQPSLHEGMSNTALEALAAGLPLVLSDTGGSAELVSDNGLIVPPQNVSQLVAALARLIDDPDQRLAMGRRSRARALQKSWSSVAMRYVACYEAIQLRAACTV